MTILKFWANIPAVPKTQTQHSNQKPLILKASAARQAAKWQPNQKEKIFFRQTKPKTTSDKKTQQPQKTKAMKKTLLAALAIGGFAFMTNASAQLTSITTYNEGDLLLGFRASGATLSSPGSTTNLIVNLGSNLNVLNGNYFDISSALTSTFGANWASLTGANQIKWGLVSSIYDPDADSYTVFASTPYNNAGSTLGADPFYYSSFGTFATVVDTVAQGFTAGTKSGGASLIAAANSLSWTKAATIDGTPDDAFGFFPGGVTSFYAPNAGYGENWIDIYQTVNSGGGSTFNYQATLGLQSNGQITLVPEPSTYALIGLGALLLIVAYRRANA